jgi:hypothetical protein
MSPELWVAIIGQTIVLLVAMIGMAIRGEHRITKVEGQISHVESVCQTVPGISRAVARIEGRHQEIDDGRISQ